MGWFKKRPELFEAGPKFYDMTREEQMEHMMKVASIIRRDPEVYDDLRNIGFINTYNLADYIQGSVSSWYLT